MDENAFKSLETTHRLPKTARRDTLGSLFALKLVMDIVDLFVSKAARVAAAALPSVSEEVPPQDTTS
ncbi:MAG: hypothetical protein OHK0039_24400 [Bacteroidia bacterium]